MISKKTLAELLNPVSKDAKRACKHESALTYLLAYGSALNADAEGWPLYDRYLNTTVSELNLKRGFSIAKEPESLVRFGKKTRFVRYKMAKSDREKAIKLVNFKRLARGANPLTEKEFSANGNE